MSLYTEAKDRMERVLNTLPVPVLKGRQRLLPIAVVGLSALLALTPAGIPLPHQAAFAAESSDDSSGGAVSVEDKPELPVIEVDAYCRSDILVHPLLPDQENVIRLYGTVWNLRPFQNRNTEERLVTKITYLNEPNKSVVIGILDSRKEFWAFDSMLVDVRGLLQPASQDTKNGPFTWMKNGPYQIDVTRESQFASNTVATAQVVANCPDVPDEPSEEVKSFLEARNK